jgi:hypothetical protein
MLDRVLRVSAITLHSARRAGPEGTPLKDVLTAARREFLPEGSDRVPEHTGATVLGLALVKLLDAHLIQILVNGEMLKVGSVPPPEPTSGLRSEQLLPVSPKTAADFEAGYGFARSLRGREHHTVIKLTEEFFKVQEALGLSLSELISRLPSSLFITPVFPQPGPKHFDVFAIMPFSKPFDAVYEEAIKPACLSITLRVGRGDDIFGATHVINDIWSAIYGADDVIADCTSKNPNVFYELGMAHTLGKKVILIARTEEDIPFDLRHWRYITYEVTENGLDKLRVTLESLLGKKRVTSS